jgi:hypothetical protein
MEQILLRVLLAHKDLLERKVSRVYKGFRENRACKDCKETKACKDCRENRVCKGLKENRACKGLRACKGFRENLSWVLLGPQGSARLALQGLK